MKETLSRIALAKINESLHRVTITTKKYVESVYEQMKSGHINEIPNLIVAELDGKYYPIGNISTLDAARLANLKTLDCNVKKAKNIQNVIEMQIINTKNETYNPLVMFQLVKQMKTTDSKISPVVIPKVFLKPCNLDKAVVKKFEQFIENMKNSEFSIPNLTPVIFNIARVKKSKQIDALNRTIHYAKNGKHYSLPDIKVITAIMSEFEKEGDEKLSPNDYVEFPDDEEYEDTEDKKEYGETKLDVKSTGKDLGTCFPAVGNMINHDCKCGRRYNINLKNGTIKELVDKGSNIAVIETEVGMIYPLGDKEAEYLSLDMSPVINSYCIGPKDMGDFVLLSKRKLTKKIVEKIHKVIR